MYQFKQTSYFTLWFGMSLFSDIQGRLSCYPHLPFFIKICSFALSHKLASITARESPIAKTSFCTYHKPLQLKCILLTAKFSSFFIVSRHISGGLICSYNLLRAISTASLSGILVYKLLTFSPRSPWLFECSFLCLPPYFYQGILPMFYLGGHMSYQVKKGRDEVLFLVCAL